MMTDKEQSKTCEIVRDLLPLYLENMASEESVTLVNKHLHECELCRAEHGRLTSLQPPSMEAMPEKDKNGAWKKVRKRLLSKVRLLCFFVVAIGVFVGTGLTNGENLYYNTVIMPVVGALMYSVFRWRAAYVTPIVVIGTQLLNFIIPLMTGDTAVEDPLSTFAFSLIYSALALVGMTVVGLIGIALGRGKTAILSERSKPSNKKRIAVRLSAAVVACLLTFGTCALAECTVGNPLSYFMAYNAAKRYIGQTYPEAGIVIERMSFDFIYRNYIVHVAYPDNIDGQFRLEFNSFGTLENDTHESITNGWTTAARLDREYRELVKPALNALPYSFSYAYGDINSVSERWMSKENAVIVEELERDKIYDMQKLGAKAGHITVRIKGELASPVSAARILLDIKSRLNEMGVYFGIITMSIEESNGNTLRLEEFAAVDITEQGLEEKIEEAIRQADHDSE